jgi:hypothetical protein
MFTVTPELAVGAWITERLRLTLGAALAFSVLSGPVLKLGDTRPDYASKNCTGNPNAIDCAPGERLDQDLAAFGRFWTLVPEASVGYWF